MDMAEEPGIGPEDVERICQEMRDWERSQEQVLDEATLVVLAHQAELERHGLLPGPPG